MTYPHPHVRVLQDDPRYSYALVRDYKFKLEKGVRASGESEYLTASAGRVLVHKGYYWDGPSGPVIHTVSWVRASLIHDVLYQMMRLEWLPLSYRKRADDLMYDLAREDNMPWWRAWYSWIAVRLFGAKHARPPGAV